MLFNIRVNELRTRGKEHRSLVRRHDFKVLLCKVVKLILRLSFFMVITWSVLWFIFFFFNWIRLGLFRDVRVDSLKLFDLSLKVCELLFNTKV